MRFFVACCIVSLGTASALGVPVPTHKSYLDREPSIAEQGTIVPSGVPLRVRLIANDTIHRLDRNGRSESDYIQHLEQAKKTGTLPPAPQVDLIFELQNTSDREMQIAVGGDACGSLALHLKGPGVIAIQGRSADQKDEFRPSAIVKLAPGGTHRWTFRELDCSNPRDTSRLYWTQAGEYLLTAGFTVAVHPAPRGAVPHWYHKGHGNVAIRSGAVRLIVLEK